MEYDPCTCRECGREFNLAYQPYYDNICPTCKNE